MKDFKEYYKGLLRENSEKKEESKASFTDDIHAAVKEHVKEPTKTIMSSHGDNFDTYDVAHNAATSIHYYMSREHKPSDVAKHIETLKRYLPDSHVDELISKHYSKNKD